MHTGTTEEGAGGGAGEGPAPPGGPQTGHKGAGRERDSAAAGERRHREHGVGRGEF